MIPHQVGGSLCTCEEPLLFPQRRGRVGKKNFFPQAAVPLPCNQCMNCSMTERSLTFRNQKGKCCFLFNIQPLLKCLCGVLQRGTKEPLMAWGVPRKRQCHLRRHWAPRVFLLSFPPAPDERPQGKWILGGGGVSCCELVCFTAISQWLRSSTENWSSIILLYQ